MLRESERMNFLTPHFFASLSSRISEMQAAGLDVIRLDEGSPDLPPAQHIIDALTRSADQADNHGYQPHRGPQALREAWSESYRRMFNIELDPVKEILPLIGSKEGIFHLLMAYIEPGDIVLVPDPGYVTYTRGTYFSGGETYPLPLLPGNDYLPDLQVVPADILARTKILFLNYPNNPTSATATKDYFFKVVEFAHQHQILICHDAAYSQVVFDGEICPSILEIPGAQDVAVEFNTLSKSHNMAGWRSGALLGNAQAIRTLYTLKTNADSGQFLPVMEASTVALTADQSWLVTRNDIYRQRRDVVIEALHKMSLLARKPKASLYVWSPVPEGWNCEAFVNAVLEETQVSLTPGTVFGKHGEGFIRISITTSLQRIELAMKRLQEWMKRCA